MNLTAIQLPTETIQALSVIAKEKGKTAEEYVRDMVDTEILAAKPFAEILAPMQQGFTESGMAEEEITALFEQAREEVYQESKSKK